MNHLRKAQGIPLARKSEISLCRPCYAKHKAKLSEETARRTDFDNDQWKLWLDGEITDEQFFARIHDQASYRELVARVKAHRDLKKPYRKQSKAGLAE